MKKLLALALALSMSLALVACSSNKETEPETTTEAETDAPETDAPETESETAGEASGETPAQTIAAKFQELAADGNEYTAYTMAEAICNANLIPVGIMPVEVEAGYLTGFDNVEITEFEEATMFAPMIGTIPFVGYVFTMPEGADVEAFVTNLENSANLRWNICVAAEEMVSEVAGNKVLFVMAPASFEQ